MTEATPLSALRSRQAARHTTSDNHRAVLDRYVQRWSPRAMAGTPIDNTQLTTLIEAARWAPSCFNSQPWHFLYAHRETEQWPALLEPIIEFNQLWAQQAGALVALLSHTHNADRNEPAPTHAFDAGAAWMSFALAANELGLVAHAMWGFDQELARAKLNIPDTYAVNAFIAVGNPAPATLLPDALRGKEVPSLRRPLQDLMTLGAFPKD